jgi:DNA/RNA-binding domain of Phe-tRNA-synthetase-like protein
MTVTVQHRVDRPDLALGLVRVEGVEVGPAATALALELDRWIAERKQRPLGADEERVRQGCREVLRNGRYRATGRGKPASEYLMRAAAEGSFPRINGPVDANNLVSLIHCVPISLWDVALGGSRSVEVRLGRAGESYVFNPTGQVLELADLVCGCALDSGGASRAIVTPIKDSLATKIRESSSELCGCIYYPLAGGGPQRVHPAGGERHAAAPMVTGRERLESATADFLKWLLTCGGRTHGELALCLPGQSVSL